LVYGGFLRAGAGKILPRPRRTVGGEEAGRPEPYKAGYGAAAPRDGVGDFLSFWHGCAAGSQIAFVGI